jgi:hypothetical protein
MLVKKKFKKITWKYVNKRQSILLLRVKISRKSDKEWLQENVLKISGFYMKYIGKYLGVEILLTRECILTFSHYTPDITVIKVQFLYLYSKIVQSEQSILYLYSKIVQSEQIIYWTQSSDWMFILVWVQNLCSKVFTRILYKTNFK